MEIWKEVQGFENRYLVSNNGKVYSLLANRILKTCISNRGYELVCLRNEVGKRKQYTVHRIVANAFVPNPNDYPIVNHIDENKLNNNVNNLEWCDYSYNNNYNHIREQSTNTYIERHGKTFFVYDKELNYIGCFNNIHQFGRIYNIKINNFSTTLRKNQIKPFYYSTHGFIPSYTKLT